MDNGDSGSGAQPFGALFLGPHHSGQPHLSDPDRVHPDHPQPDRLLSLLPDADRPDTFFFLIFKSACKILFLK